MAETEMSIATSTTQRTAQSAPPDDLAASAAEGMLGPNPFVGLRPRDILATVQQIGAQALRQPSLVVEQEAALVRDLIAVLGGSADSKPAQGDKRFTDPAWQDNAMYRMTMQGYVAWRNALTGFVDRSALDARTKERAQFVLSLFTDAVSPTNTLLGNPAALKKVIDSGGASLLGGVRNLVTDMLQNQGMPAQVDKTAFKVGENLGTSPGAVVFRNEVLELIQYAPATEHVYARPQLIVPPQINKFYVFDLSEGKSIVDYLVKNEFQTFVVSWRNPTAEQSHWDLDTYVAALLEAIAAIREITGSDDVNLHGACSGAMTISALLGHLAICSPRRKRLQPRSRTAYRKACWPVRKWAACSHGCAPTISSGTTGSTTICSARRRPRSTSSTGTTTRPACPRACMGNCSTSSRATCSASRVR